MTVNGCQLPVNKSISQSIKTLTPMQSQLNPRLKKKKWFRCRHYRCLSLGNSCMVVVISKIIPNLNTGYNQWSKTICYLSIYLSTNEYNKLQLSADWIYKALPSVAPCWIWNEGKALLHSASVDWKTQLACACDHPSLIPHHTFVTFWTFSRRLCGLKWDQPSCQDLIEGMDLYKRR